MPKKSEDFGRFFRTRRAGLGLSLSEFCRRNGFDKGNISRLERGLNKPPESGELLDMYADALQLRQDSEDRKAFMRHAAIARGKLPADVTDERAGDVEEIFRKLGSRLHDSWVKSRDLEQWSQTREAQAELPTLVRKLIYASTDETTRIELPGGDNVQRHGWDGVVEAPATSLFVPAGVSGWEISVEQRPAVKAERDFKDRKKGPLGLPPSEVTFVFVTSRKWDGKQKWRDEKRALGKWKSVEIYDSSDLEAWLELAPGVDAWLAERLGRRPPGVISISDYWESLSRICEPPLKPDVFVTSREKTAKQFRDFLLGPPGVLAFECRSPTEAVDFVAAYLAMVKADDAQFAMPDDERLRALSRTVVVRDRAQWEGLSQESRPLNLLLMPSLSLTGEELNVGVNRGHRIIIAATQFANHRLKPASLPRPSRYDLKEALCKSGFDREAADKAARAAGGSLSVLKRHISTTPCARLPGWCSEPGRTAFMPMLLVGAWDEANEVDRTVVSRLADRSYREVQQAANRVMLAEEAPLTRTESRWRLVSPEDSWSLVGGYVTEELLSSFETIAIEVLGQEDATLELSADERFKASIMETLKPTASEVLRHGVSETAAILGSAFGPVAELPGARGRADTIVRNTIQNATWLTWATLGSVLPLLAEAAPEVFLATISSDLKKKHPELEKLLADDGDDHPLMSRCNHAGLLWALEGLAWSPELFPDVSKILARLAEVDTGRKWGNRPATSLREILLTWYPQTAAGVDKRIAVLRSLAERTPKVAWKLLFELLPHVHSTSSPTRRPVWRDWVSAWQEGTSGADYWKQVDAAAELIVGQVGNDPTKWTEILDHLQAIPNPRRDQLIELLRNLPVDEIATDERRRLAEHLRTTIRKHRDFADAQWALPADSVDGLEQALPRLLPVELSERHAWLFVSWLELEGFGGNYKGMKAEVERLRTEALREIVAQSGLDGVLKLADVAESPEDVGWALGKTNLLVDTEILPHRLRSSNEKHQKLAANYARARIFRAGWDWVRSLSLDKWSADDAACLLSQAGLTPKAWSLAESLGEEVVSQYWKTVQAIGGLDLDQQQIEFVCQKLIEADRPEHAVRVLSGITIDRFTVSPLKVMDALTACVEWRQANPDTSLRDDTLRTIQRLFGWLQDNILGCLQDNIQFGNEEPVQRLAKLESQYLDLLDGFGATPKTLDRYLSEDPGSFQKVIALIFRPKDVDASYAEPTDADQVGAGHAYRLLMNWKRIPGTRSDGSIDESQLQNWVDSARSLCRKSGHLEIAEIQIGEMLASWPKPEDGDTLWPCEEIRDVIEELESEDLDEGFRIGIMNSRGVVCRSPLAGGDLERQEAAKYRRWAELCDTEWPRTAATLRSVAECYDFEAQHEDGRAAECAHERY